MNKERRKQVMKIVKELEKIKSDIESVMEDEQCAYECLPENLQNSMRASNMEEAIDILDNAASSVDDVVNYLEEVV